MGQRSLLGGRRNMSGARLRWMSVSSVAVVASVLAGTMLANAASPALPKRTPAQLLAAMRHAKPPAQFYAAITENANLGLPSLPNIAGLKSTTLNAVSWLTGTHTVDVWYGGPRKVRIAVPVSFGETDLRVDGKQVWLWDSKTQTATHLLPTASLAPGQVKRLPAPARPNGRIRAVAKCVKAIRGTYVKPGKRRQLTPRELKAMRGKLAKCLGVKLPAVPVKPPSGKAVRVTPLTPRQAAKKILAALGPTTKVSVAGSTTVAGRAAYQLVIAPRTGQSLIKQVVIAVDAATYLPLQVQVFARGGNGAAFSIGFSSFAPGPQAASYFSFTPPKGAHVKTEHLPVVLPGAGLLGATAFGAPIATPVIGTVHVGTGSRYERTVPPARVRKLMKRIHKVVQRRLLKPHSGKHVVNVEFGSTTPLSATPLSATPLSGLLSGAKVLGKGWLSVAVIRAPALSAAITGTGSHTVRVLPVAPSSTRASTAKKARSAGPAQTAVQAAALLRLLLNAATKVHGSWGHGKLVSTSLFSALVTSKGYVLIGAVQPGVLLADAAKVK